jgi:uncharacterized LabA/DUF88 family protein
MLHRAVIFIDGNNWYHSLREVGLVDVGRLDYAIISQKLIGPRVWVGTRYYIGQVRQSGNTTLYADQRRFLSSLQATDHRITCHLGRLEERRRPNEAAEELIEYLNNLGVRIDTRVFHDLMRIGHNHRNAAVMVEKAVDVQLAVDMVIMAERDEYDAAYLLSADGDFTPAVKAARSLAKRVYAASPAPGAKLAGEVNSYIRLKRDWFHDCFRP